MPNLFIIRGLPGSGKSTYSSLFLAANLSAEMPENIEKQNSLNCVRVNKDMMRQMYQNGWFFGSDEHMNALMYQSVEYFLGKNISVVSDNMNLDPKHLVQFFEIARSVEQKTGLTVKIEIHDIVTPIEVCILRDAKRAKPVGAGTIELLHQRWCQNQTLTGFPSVTIPIDLHLIRSEDFKSITGVRHANNQPE